MTRPTKSKGDGAGARRPSAQDVQLAKFADKVLEKLELIRVATIGSEELSNAVLARLDRLEEHVSVIRGHVQVIPGLATKLDGAAQCSQSALDAVMLLRKQIEDSGVIIARAPRAVRTDRRG